jgi:D-sedoheptulose 7-phosphate isomerase
MTAFDGSADRYLTKLTALLTVLDRRQIDEAVGVIEAAWKRGAQIIALGNGGSALNGLHFIHDWNKSVFLATGRPFRGRTLADNVGLLMAYSNDLSYEDALVGQLKNDMQPGDLVLAISGSGNSENVIRAVEWANANGGVTLGLVGYDGGRLKPLAQHVVWADVNDMQLVEDAHAIFGHVVMQTLCEMK